MPKTRFTQFLDGNYTLRDVDSGTTLICNSATPFTITTHSPTGKYYFDTLIVNYGSADVTCGGLEITQYSHAHVTNTGTEWVVVLGGGEGGSVGYTGSVGYSGSTGYSGSQGEVGFTGSKGDTGYTGSASTTIGYTGSQGEVGLTGSSGTNGYNGSSGFTGSKGDVGFTGSLGYTGSIGVGYTGSVGVGLTGSQGSTGFDGSVGFTGSKGEVGLTGSASTVAGYTGSKGDTGFTGSQGEIGYTGSQGYTGSASTEVGYTGSQGEIGYTGSSGSGGYSAWEMSATPTLTWETADPVVEDVSYFTCSQGLNIKFVLGITASDGNGTTGLSITLPTAIGSMPFFLSFGTECVDITSNYIGAYFDLMTENVLLYNFQPASVGTSLIIFISGTYDINGLS